MAGKGGAAPPAGAPAGEAVLSCAAYASSSVLLTLANKAVFSERRLDYPWMLLGLQSSIVTLLLGAYYAVRRRRFPVDPALLRMLALPCLFFTLFIYSNARALRYISLPLLSVMKSLSPMGIALVERVMYGQQVAMGTYVAMLLIVASNAVSVLYDLEYHPAGYMWAMLNCAVNIAYVVMLRHYVKTDLSNGEKTLHNNVLLTAVSLSSAVLSGELPGFLLEFGATSARFKLLYAASCVLAVAIGTSVFWVLQATSGSTLSFVGASNKVFVVILGAVLFDVNISRAGWFGIVLGISASISFTVSKAQAAAGSYAPVDAAASHMSDVESDDEDSLDGRGGGDAGRGA